MLMHVNARFRDENDGVRFRFAVVGLCQKKTEQNQNRIFELVPRGGVKFFLVFRLLACPTFAKRPVESQ